MSPAVTNGLLLSVVVVLTALFVLPVATVIFPHPAPPPKGAARRALDFQIAQFGTDLSANAAAVANRRGWTHISHHDIRAEYRERRVWKATPVLRRVTRYRAIALSTAGLIFALPSFPHFPELSPGYRALTDGAGTVVVVLAFVFDGSELTRAWLKLLRRQPKTDERADRELRRCRKRMARRVERKVRRWAGGPEVTAADVDDAWAKLVKPPPAVVVGPRRVSVLRRAATFVAVAAVGVLYGFSLAAAKLPTGTWWPFVLVLLAPLAFYLLLVSGPPAIAALGRVPVTVIGAVASRRGRRSRQRIGATGKVSQTVEIMPDSGEETGTAMAGQGSPPPASPGNRGPIRTRAAKARRELRDQLTAMRNAAGPFLTDDGRKAYWANAWEGPAVRAAARATSNRRRFYSLRLTAIISVTAVPALVGLDLSGAGGGAVRWLAFSLSLIAAVSTVITLQFQSDRWIMDRTLSDSLINAGWALVTSPHGDPQAAWHAFTAATGAAMARYEAAYQTVALTPGSVTTAGTAGRADGDVVTPPNGGG
jgi:hypothetical protein